MKVKSQLEFKIRARTQLPFFFRNMTLIVDIYWSRLLYLLVLNLYCYKFTHSRYNYVTGNAKSSHLHDAQETSTPLCLGQYSPPAFSAPTRQAQGLGSQSFHPPPGYSCSRRKRGGKSFRRRFCRPPPSPTAGVASEMERGRGINVRVYIG